MMKKETTADFAKPNLTESSRSKIPFSKMITEVIDADTNQRKNFSLWMMFGGAIIFTIFTAISLFLVRHDPHYVFWLGIAAHFQVFSVLAGFISQLVKRRVLISKQGMGIEDLLNNTTDDEEEIDASDLEEYDEYREPARKSGRRRRW